MRLQRSGGCTAFAALFILSTILLAGCNSTAVESETADAPHGHGHGHGHDHDHGARPKSLHQTVDQLARIEQAVGDAILAGDSGKAHGPLHTVAGLLEAIPDIAAETDLPKKEWEAVKAASERLFDAYAVIDKAFHVKDGDKQAAYKQVADELAEGLEEIRSRLPLTGEPAPVSKPEADHGHDHSDHDHHDHDHANEEGVADS